MNDATAGDSTEAVTDLDDTDVAESAAAEAVVSDLDRLLGERDEMRALAQQIQADFENYRKQAMRRETGIVERASEGLVEKLLKDSGDKVEPAEREKIEAALTTLKEALAGTDVDAVRTAHEALIGASQEFAQRLYAASSAAASGSAEGDAGPGGPGASGSGPVDDDEVAEAEIVDEPGQATGS